MPFARSTLLLSIFLWSGATYAQRPKRQELHAHEWRADFELTLTSNAQSAALIDVLYTWTPARLDRYDVVVPPLRRFVRHPSSLWARAKHDGSTIDQTTSIGGGGTLQLFDGRLYGSASAAVERDNVRYTFNEDIYWTTPLGVEIGGRPLELLSLGAYAQARPIFASEAGDHILQPTSRSGMDYEVGGTVTGATPNDRVLATLSVGYWTADWDYEDFHPGELGAKGLRGTLRLAFQTSATMSYTMYLRGRAEDWNNERLGESDPDFVGEKLERRIYGFEGDIGFQYWFKGRLAFRVTLGGGFLSEPPIFYRIEGNGGDYGFGRLGAGFVTRY